MGGLGGVGPLEQCDLVLADLVAQLGVFDAQALLGGEAKHASLPLNLVVVHSQSRIAELSKARSGSQTDLQRLRSELAAAKTPQEQKAITERIVVKQVEVQRQDGQIAGETCLAAPVPDRLLATWRGVAL